MVLAGMLAVLAAAPAAAEGSATPHKYAGTYRIEGWHDLQANGLYHFFYLHPNGHFLLAGEWPKNERSHFVGTWTVSGDKLYLSGRGAVDTNQGAWRADFSRTFRIRVGQGGFVLEPEPAKNRFGLMGWPNAYHFYRSQPVPNLPGVTLPADADGLARYIAKLEQRLR